MYASPVQIISPKKTNANAFNVLFIFFVIKPHQPLTAVWCYYFAYNFYLRLEVSARQNNRHQAANR